MRPLTSGTAILPHKVLDEFQLAVDRRCIFVNYRCVGLNKRHKKQSWCGEKSHQRFFVPFIINRCCMSFR